MKRIKWILYTLYVGFYTSLIWATCIWNGILVGQEGKKLAIGVIVVIGLTLLNLLCIIMYLWINWNEK